VHNIARWLAAGTDKAHERATASEATDAGVTTTRPPALAEREIGGRSLVTRTNATADPERDSDPSWRPKAMESET
jgi:hypothetical protein